jgi:hypothetical protein
MTTNATNYTTVTADFPDFVSDTIDFVLLSSVAISGSEIFPGKTYTVTLDVNGVGSTDIPTPDGDGTLAWLWRVELPDGRKPIASIAWNAASQALATILAAEVSTTTPSDVSQLIATKQDKDTDAVEGNAAMMDADGQAVDAGFAFGTAAAIDDAPSDGNQYARQDGAWIEVDVAGLAVLEAALIPVAIADMTATADGSDTIDLAWTYTAVAYTAGFKVYRKTGAGSYALIDTIASGLTTYEDTGLDASTEYIYRVDAYNNFFQTAGNEDSATTTAQSLDDLMLSLPGIISYKRLLETSGTVAADEIDTGLNGSYVNAPTLASDAMPNGELLPAFDGVDQCVNLYTSDFSDALDGEKGWVMLWARTPEPENMNDDYLMYVSVDSPNRIYIDTLPNRYILRYYSQGAQKLSPFYSTSTKYHLFAMAWDQAADEFVVWVDGVRYYEASGLGLWSGGALGSSVVTLMGQVNSGSKVLLGSSGEFAWGAGEVLSDENVDAIWDNVIGDLSQDITFAGDSKLNGAIWSNELAGLLTNDGADYWRSKPVPLNSSGWNVAALYAAAQSAIPTAGGDPSVLCLNIGVNNSFGAPIDETAFKANYIGIIDTYRARWPDIQIYCSRIWARTATSYATTNSYIDDIIATQDYIHAGPDESIWMENGDDGATYSSDGLHYNDAGNLEAAAQWLTALGY